MICRQHQRPNAPAALRIYEAHVGMSSEEASVASYTYFKGNAVEPAGAPGADLRK